jgi:hypothetical protein
MEAGGPEGCNRIEGLSGRVANEVEVLAIRCAMDIIQATGGIFKVGGYFEVYQYFVGAHGAEDLTLAVEMGRDGTSSPDGADDLRKFGSGSFIDQPSGSERYGSGDDATGFN